MQIFQVPVWLHYLGEIIERNPGLFLRFAKLEDQILEERIADQPVVAPIFVTGLARAGTTVWLEILEKSPQVGTHQYRDFPCLYVPYAWAWLLQYIETKQMKPVERAHGDRIMITSKSPEAMEEFLWMAFFPHVHHSSVNNCLDDTTDNPSFERIYATHIRKVLIARKATRYLSKGNYNISRVEYIRRIFPDARFILAIREPVSHIGSAMRQHQRFTAGMMNNPRAHAHLRRVGHFEFGPNRCAINPNATNAIAEVNRLWADGQEVRGWARYWAVIYTYLADLLDAKPAVAASCKVMRYEDLCAAPFEEIGIAYRHALLQQPPGLIQRQADWVSAPNYYDPGFTPQDLEVIYEETAATARRFGYYSAEHGSKVKQMGNAS